MIDQQKIFQEIIDHPDLQPFFFPEEKDRTPLRLVTSDKINGDIKLHKFNVPVVIIKSSSDDLPSLKIIKFTTNTNTGEFELTYDIQGLIIVGEIKKNNSEWSIENFEVWEQ